MCEIAEVGAAFWLACWTLSATYWKSSTECLLSGSVWKLILLRLRLKKRGNVYKRIRFCGNVVKRIRFCKSGSWLVYLAGSKRISLWRSGCWLDYLRLSYLKGISFCESGAKRTIFGWGLIEVEDWPHLNCLRTLGGKRTCWLCQRQSNWGVPNCLHHFRNLIILTKYNLRLCWLDLVQPLGRDVKVESFAEDLHVYDFTLKEVVKNFHH